MGMIELLSSTWTDIAAIPDSQRVMVMVVGPTEQHGPHLPFGTDIYAAEEMLSRILPLIETTHRLVAIKAPPILYTPAVLSREYAGSVSVRKHHFRAYLTDVLASFAQNGISRAILVSSHIDPPFVHATQSACHAVNQTFGVRYINGYERFPCEDVIRGIIAQEMGYPAHLADDVHAGLMETSNMLYLRPNLVRHETAQRLAPQPMDFQAMRQLRSLRSSGSGDGYIGFPADGRAEYGERWFTRYAKLFGAVVHRYLSGEDVSDDLAIAPLFPELAASQ